MEQVWMVTSGEYEYWGVDGIYDSLESAVELTKATYPPPYIVRWEHRKYCGADILIGRIDAVPEYSIPHTVVFTIEPREVQVWEG